MHVKYCVWRIRRVASARVPATRHAVAQVTRGNLRWPAIGLGILSPLWRCCDHANHRLSVPSVLGRPTDLEEGKGVPCLVHGHCRLGHGSHLSQRGPSPAFNACRQSPSAPCPRKATVWSGIHNIVRWPTRRLPRAIGVVCCLTCSPRIPESATSAADAAFGNPTGWRRSIGETRA
jgi:hypothetical protein